MTTTVTTQSRPTAATATTVARRRMMRPIGRLVLAIATVLVVWQLPEVLSPRNQNIVDLALLAALGALGLNLVLGIAGQVSIANSAFLAVGGYAAATFGGINGWPTLPTIILSGFVGALIGAAVGLP